MTHILAEFYHRTLISSGIEAKLFDFRNMPESMLFSNPVFSGPGSEIQKVADEFIQPAQKIVFVIPEYNGSYPGILKVFIDGFKPELFQGKKAALLGMATGRAGNLRGIDHLTDVLMHLGMQVLNNRLPVSRFHTLLNDQKQLSDEATIKALQKHQEQLLNF